MYVLMLMHHNDCACLLKGSILLYSVYNIINSFSVNSVIIINVKIIFMDIIECTRNNNAKSCSIEISWANEKGR